MPELRLKMFEALQLRCLSARTQECYVRAVRQLAEHFRKSPDLISEDELRQYFLYLKNVKNYSRSATTIALCGIKFFFQQTLNKDFPLFDFIRPSARVDNRVTGKLCAEVQGVEYRRPVCPSTLVISSDFSGAERGSEPCSPMIPLSDSLLLPIFGNEAGGHRLV